MPDPILPPLAEALPLAPPIPGLRSDAGPGPAMTHLPNLGDDDTVFDRQLAAWRAGLHHLDPVFLEDFLCATLAWAVRDALQDGRPMAPLVPAGRLERLVDALLEDGAMLDHVPLHGGNYLLADVTASQHPGRWTVANLLLDRGADPWLARSTGSPWIAALNQRQAAFIDGCLARQTTVRFAPLHHLMNGKDASVEDLARPVLPMARRLLDSGADLEDTGFGLGTPFVMAVERGYPDVAQLLLDRGANRHATRSAFRPMDRDDGWTVLHLMAARNAPEACVWLLERGLDPAARSFNGATPMDVAREHEAWHAVAVLERAALTASLAQESPLTGEAPADPERRVRSRL